MWLLLACQTNALTLTLKDTPLSVEVADTTEERTVGLMYRDSLSQNTGMLFVYPDSAERAFWMKNTRIPLSIAFIDSSGKIVHLADMQPMDTHTTASTLPAMYALEVNKGWFTEHNIQVGDTITGLPTPPSQ